MTTAAALPPAYSGAAPERAPTLLSRAIAPYGALAAALGGA